jgi:hypothetical protein
LPTILKENGASRCGIACVGVSSENLNKERSRR